MFKPLGLLFDTPCPDRACRRPVCLFRHGESSRGAAAPPTGGSSGAVRKREGEDGVQVASKRTDGVSEGKREGEPVERIEVKKPKAGARSNGLDLPRPNKLPARSLEPVRLPEKLKAVGPTVGYLETDVVRADYPQRAKTPPLPSVPVKAVPAVSTNVGSAGVVTSSSISPSPSKPTRAPTLAQTATQNGIRPPSLPWPLKNSPQPFTDRQQGLQVLFTQFAKLYSALTSHPALAAESTLLQEAEVSQTSPNVKAYKSAIRHAAASILRRPPPDDIDHPSVGTVKESRVKTEAFEKALAGRLTRWRIEKYCLPLDDYATWRYPDPRDPELLVLGGNEPDATGTTQTCSRCKSPFVVSPAELAERFGECKFHHGKTLPERIEGRRKWIYTCCRRERGEVGCQEGVHVFTDKEDDVALGKRVGWRSVKALCEGVGKEARWVDVLGLDCEMIYTTAGSSLARVTLVDQDGQTLLDELVRQTVPILDVNSRFSGIHEGDLDQAVMDLQAVRAAACVLIGPETILVGHGLENDLRALRILHDKVIDTAILFPHDRGAPYRRALRDLVKEKLGYFIQDRTADLGHSSAEDAKATLEVLKWKVRDDQATI